MLDKSGAPSGRSAAGQAGNGAPKNGAQTAAEQASLTYVSDSEPGIRRLKAGKGFSYKGAKGQAVGAAAIARIKALAIPPAWTDVWISPDAAGHIQATGRDQRGRKQYRYHPLWAPSATAPNIRALSPLPKACLSCAAGSMPICAVTACRAERVVAAIVWLLDNTMIRVGNAAYARDNKSFGLTTLRDRHVDIKGSSLRFAFKGKSGKEWKLKLVDRRIARVVRGAQDIPGQKLFQYLDEDGNRRPVHSDDVNRYIRDAVGADFSSKHFRTWGGTIHAASLFAQTELPESQARSEAGDEHRHRQGSRAVGQHARRLPQMLHPSAGLRSLVARAAARRNDRGQQAQAVDRRSRRRGSAGAEMAEGRS